MSQRAGNNHGEASTRWRSTKKGWKSLCWVHPGGPRGGDPRAEPTSPPGTVPRGMQEQRRGDGHSLGMALESPRVQAGAGNPNPTAVSSRFRSRLEALPVFCSSPLREASRAGANRAPAAPKRIGHLQGNVDPIPKWGQEGSRGLPSSREWPQRGSWGGRELLQRLCPSPSPPPPCVPLPTFNPGGLQPLKSQFPRVLWRSRPHRGDRAHPQPQKNPLRPPPPRSQPFSKAHPQKKPETHLSTTATSCRARGEAEGKQSPPSAQSDTEQPPGCSWVLVGSPQTPHPAGGTLRCGGAP